MRIYTKAGDLAFKTFTFPDGQPHFKLETYEREFSDCTIELAIKSPTDLFLLGLVADTLRQHGYSILNVDIRYLLGARMDRAISSMEPTTLQYVARVINGMGFNRVRILDVHSEVATRLIRNSENVLPFKVFSQVTLATGSPAIVCPDKGAQDRVHKLAGYESAGPIIYCYKERDPHTGALSGFKIGDPDLVARDKNVLIVDDICDGGATFVGLAKALRKDGAKKVYLYVTHGIFSKGLPLEGIDKIFTTDSYVLSYQQLPLQQSSQWTYLSEHATVVPISMKELP